MNLYILEGKTLVPCDFLTWARWYEIADHVVAETWVSDVDVSTVFLGLDHQWGEGPPLLFETMIFRGVHDGYQERSSTWDAAERAHAAAIAMLQEESR